MKGLANLLGKKEFHILLFHVCLILFGWPVVTFHDLDRLESMFVYLFLAWGSVIAVLFFMAGVVDVPEKFQETDTHENIHSEPHNRWDNSTGFSEK